jgi:hypothetical protein
MNLDGDKIYTKFVDLVEIYNFYSSKKLHFKSFSYLNNQYNIQM